jgi:thiamine transport system permease protein
MPGRVKASYQRLIPGTIVSCALFLMASSLLLLLLTYSDTDIRLGSRYQRILGWSALQATLSTILSVVIGITLAWALSHRRQFFGRRLLIALLSSALVLPTLVVVLGLVTVLGRAGWINDGLQALGLNPFEPFIYGLPGILIAHTYFNASFAARTLLNRFESIPASQLKLSTSLGLNAWQRFRLLEFPALAAALPALCTTIFLLCFTSFAIVLVLGGSPKYNTLEVSIYEAIKLDFDLGRAAGLAMLQLAVCALLVLATNRAAKALTIDTPARRPVYQHGSTAEVICQSVIIGIFAIFFITPLLAIVSDGLTGTLPAVLAQPVFIKAIATSLAIATASSVIVVVFSVLICNAITTLTLREHIQPSLLMRTTRSFIQFSATLYLVIPSLVLGLGFFLLARKTGGSYFLWSIVALLAANTLLVLPFALTNLAPAMIKTANRYDRLAQSLSITGLSRWRLVESALVRPELTYVASLAFCMSLGDLGVIALFGSQDFVTLPWLLYQKMGSYRTDEAAVIALVTLTLTLVVFFALPSLLRVREQQEKPNA